MGNINAEWKPIPSTTDPGVVANARFAVSEYDKEKGRHLVFVNVVEGNYTRGASGNIYYQLIVKAKDDRFGTSNNYNTVVRDYLDGRRDLIGFW